MKFFNQYKKDFLKAIESQYYSEILEIYDIIHFYTIKWMKVNEIRFAPLPITTQSISSPMGLGSDSKPFKVKSVMNDLEFFLADSMQFHLELLLRSKRINKVGYFSNSFRGENVDVRHLHQFNHFEIEIIGEINKCKLLAISYLKYIIKKILIKLKSNSLIKKNIKNLKTFLKNKPINLEYTEAIKILNQYYPEGINDTGINSAGEQYLLRMYKNKGIFLNNFPTELVPFYQRNNDGFAVNSDFLIGIGETIGMGERCFDDRDLIESINLHKNNTEEYKWYIKIKKERPLITSGFGVGIERLILFLTNQYDIRNVTLIPRDTHEIIEP